MTTMIETEYLPCIKNMRKIVTKKGEKGRKPSEGSVCSVVVSIKEGETEVPSLLFNQGSSTFTIGDAIELEDRVLEYCVMTMAVEEESLYEVPDLKLSFTVILDACYFKPYIFQMSDNEKLALTDKYKAIGVKLFNEKKIVHAFFKFGQAFKVLHSLRTNYSVTDSYDENINQSDLENLKINIFNNLSACQLQCKNYSHLITLCSKSLDVKPNVKAYYRRALAYIETSQYEDAENDLLELLKLEPQNAAATDKLALVRVLNKNNREKYKETVKKMFVTK